VRGPRRIGLAARALAAVLLAAAAAGCADILAPPAEGGARLSLQLGRPARQTSPDSAFDAVDGLSVVVYRGETVVMADSFAVSPAGSVIRQFILVPVEGDEETLYLVAELHAGGQTVFAGDAVLRLVRGALTTVEVELVPVFFPPDPGIGAAAVPSRGRFATRAEPPLRPRAGALP
jgi:hypothetical protein